MLPPQVLDEEVERTHRAAIGSRLSSCTLKTPLMESMSPALSLLSLATSTASDESKATMALHNLLVRGKRKGWSNERLDSTKKSSASAAASDPLPEPTSYTADQGETSTSPSKRRRKSSDTKSSDTTDAKKNAKKNGQSESDNKGAENDRCSYGHYGLADRDRFNTSNRRDRSGD